MKTLKFSHLILAILFCLGMMKLTSCSKEEVIATGGTSDEVYVGGGQDGSGQTDGDGCMIVLVAKYNINSVVQTMTSVVAFFPSVPGGTDNYQDVGTVTMNGHTLTPDGNNLYTYQSFSELDFADGINWTVQGGSGVTGFTHSYNTAPAVYTVDVPPTASLSSNITVSASNLSNADSVQFAMISPNQSIWTMQGGNWTYFTFTPSQLAHLNTGEGMGVITSFCFTSIMVDGKKFYFANERSVSSPVILTN